MPFTTDQKENLKHKISVWKWPIDLIFQYFSIKFHEQWPTGLLCRNATDSLQSGKRSPCSNGPSNMVKRGPG